MARPTTRRTAGGPGYGIQQRGARVGLQVVAPLNVQARDARAESLANALRTIASPAMQAAESAAFEQGKADVTDARTKALVDTGNPEQRRQEIEAALKQPGTLGEKLKGIFDPNFKTGFRARTRDEAAGKVYALRAYQQAQNNAMGRVDQIDKTLPPEEYQDAVEQIMREEMGGMESDPLSASVIAPRYAEFLGKVMQNHMGQAVQRQRDDAINAVTTDSVQDLASGGDGNYLEGVDTLTKVTGNREEAVDIMVETFIQRAIEDGDERYLTEKLPREFTNESGQKIPGPITSTKHRDKINAGIERARAVREEREKVQRSVENLALEQSLEGRFKSGERFTLEEMTALVGAGKMSDERANWWLNRTLDVGAAEVDSAWVMDIYAAGEDAHLVVGGRTPSGKVVTEELLDQGFTDHVNRMPPEERVAFALQQGQIHQRPLKSLRAQLNAVSQSNPETALKNFEVYQQVKAAGLASIYLSDDAAAMYDAIERGKRAGDSDDVITENIRQRDPKVQRENIKRYAPEVDKQLANVTAQKRLFGDTTVDDLDNAAAARVLTRGYAEHALAQGANVEEALEFATARLAETHFVATMGDKKVLLPRASGASPEAMQYAHEELLPQYAQERGLDAENVMLMPFGPNGELMVVDQFGIRVSADTWTPSSITAHYKRSIEGKGYEAERLRSEKAQGWQKLKQSVIGSLVSGRDEFGVEGPVKFDFTPVREKKGGPRMRYANGRPVVDPQGHSTEQVEGITVTGPRGTVPEDQRPLVMSLVEAHSNEQGLDPKLAKAVASVESKGGQWLRNPKSSARGPMHILKGTFDGINDKHFDGKLNWNSLEDQTRASVAFLKHLTDKYKDTEVAFAAYLLGEPSVDRVFKSGGKQAVFGLKPPGQNMSVIAYVQKALSNV